MSGSQPDWRNLFGSVDVSSAGIQPASAPPGPKPPSNAAADAETIAALMRMLPAVPTSGTIRISPPAGPVGNPPPVQQQPPAPIIQYTSMPPKPVQTQSAAAPSLPPTSPAPPKAVDQVFSDQMTFTVAPAGSVPKPMPGQAAKPQQVAPGVMQMATSFGTSMAKFAASGFKTVSREVHDARFAVCKTCDQHTGTKCLACGCWTDKKAWMPHEACPLGKWQKTT